MSFKIAVFIKQVPDTNDIRWTEHNTIQREGLESVINPYDIGAIQLAKNVKFLLKDCEITAVSMGPMQAKEALKEALSMGCDKAYLLCDKKFAGSDTLATAYVLSQFIKTKLNDFNLIICGYQAVDGDTAQTPSSLAQKLDIPQITNVSAVKEVHCDYSVWFKDTNDYSQTIKINHPALISTTIKNAEILPDINSYIKAQTESITVFNADEIEADQSKTGFVGSPTQVKKAFRPVIERNTKVVESDNTDSAANYILDIINKCKEQDEK